MSEYHVASLIGRSHPDHFGEISKNINAMQGCEIHGTDDSGKFIVSIEANNNKDIADRFINLQQIPHLIDLSLVYHEYVDEASETETEERS